MVKSKNVKRDKKSLSPMISDRGLTYFRWFLLAALAVVLFYPPFLRGLYFEKEQLPAEIYVFVVFVVFSIFKIFKRDRDFLQTPLDYASFGFVVVYFISIFVAVSTRQAIGEWLKYCMYFAVFFMLSELANTFTSRTAMLWVIIVSALGVSFIGIDGAAGGKITAGFNLLFLRLGAANDIFFGTFVGNRINSTLQYPNALASYLMAVYFVSVGVMTTSTKIWSKVIAAVSGYVLIITFMLTMSRGAYVFLPIAAVIFIVVLPGDRRARGIAFALPSAIAMACTVVKLTNYIANPDGNEMNIWKYVFAGMCISAIVSAAISIIVKYIEKWDWKIYAVFSILVVVAGGVGTVLALNTKVPLTLSHAQNQAESILSIRRSIALVPDKDYKLVFEVDARKASDKPNAYAVSIASRNFAGTIEGRDTQITTFEGNASNGKERKELQFKVPSDSRTISVTFNNQFQGTEATFYNAKIVPADQNGDTKELTLKYRYIPESFYSRIDEAKETKSGIERTIFYKDGMRIFKDHWFLGAGGGAWPILYFSYQSYLYWTTQAHNYIVQIAVECGILGILVLLALIAAVVSSLINSLRMRRYMDSRDAVLHGALFTSITAMLMHSAVDFDLSLSAVFLVLWEFIALMNSITKNQTVAANIEMPAGGVGKFIAELDIQDRVKKLKVHPIIGMFVVLVLLVFSMTFRSGAAYNDKALEAYSSQNMTDAIQYMKKAVAADGLASIYKGYYSNWYVRQDAKVINQKEFQIVNKYMEQVEKDAKHDVQAALQAASYYIFTGSVDKGLNYVEKAVELRPFRPEEWQQKADGYMQVALFYLQKGDTKKADNCFDEILKIPSEIKEANKKNMIPFAVNPETQSIIEKVKVIRDYGTVQKDIDLGKFAFYPVNDMDGNSDGIPDQWSTATPGDIKLGIKDGHVTAESVGGKSGSIQTRPLTLQAGKTYRVEVELANPKGVDMIPFAISGVSEKNTGLQLSGGTFIADVTTAGDFKANNNVLVLGVSGKMDIKSVRITEK